MANGDAAAAAGMDVVPGTADRREGYDEINKTRDYIAERTSAVTPVAKGGTGATTAAAARTNLGAASTDASSLTAGTLPNARITNLPAAQVQNVTAGGESVQSSLNTLGSRVSSMGGGSYALKRDDSNCNFGNYGMYSQNIRGFNVTTDYASVYVNGSGGGYRMGVTPSAERFKQDVVPQVYTAEQVKLIQVVAYRLKAAVAENPNASGEVGVIAEHLIAAGLPEFVVFDDDGNTQSVAYERLVLVTIGALQDMLAQVEDLTSRVSALEAAGA